eukprot:jgi/Chrzof1/6910/Cz02g03030.t1
MQITQETFLQDDGCSNGTYTDCYLGASVVKPTRVEPEIFRLNGVCRLIYYYCDCSSDCGGVVAMEFS